MYEYIRRDRKWCWLHLWICHWRFGCQGRFDGKYVDLFVDISLIILLWQSSCLFTKGPCELLSSLWLCHHYHLLQSSLKLRTRPIRNKLCRNVPWVDLIRMLMWMQQRITTCIKPRIYTWWYNPHNMELNWRNKIIHIIQS